MSKQINAKVQVFTRLLGQVASETMDQKFRAELRENSGVLRDRATQLKILASVKSGQGQRKSNFVGGDTGGQVGQATLGLRLKVKEMLDTLAIGTIHPDPPLHSELHSHPALNNSVAAEEARRHDKPAGGHKEGDGHAVQKQTADSGLLTRLPNIFVPLIERVFAKFC